MCGSELLSQQILITRCVVVVVVVSILRYVVSTTRLVIV